MFEIKTLDFLHNISISTWHVTLVCQRPWDHRIPEKKHCPSETQSSSTILNQFQSSPFNAKCLGKVQSPVQSVKVTSTNCKLQRKHSIPSVNLKNVKFGKWAQEKDRHTAKITIATWEVAKRKKIIFTWLSSIWPPNWWDVSDSVWISALTYWWIVRVRNVGVHWLH